MFVTIVGIVIESRWAGWRGRPITNKKFSPIFSQDAPRETGHLRPLSNLMVLRESGSKRPNKTFLQVVRAFHRNDIQFLIAGARALAFHGFSRFTKDYDLCVTPDPSVIDRVLDVLSGLGFQISEPVDAVMISQSINMHFTADVDIDLLIRPKGFSFEKAWERRVTVKEEDCEIHFVSKADLITMKEASGRPQDRLDIENLKKR